MDSFGKELPLNDALQIYGELTSRHPETKYALMPVPKQDRRAPQLFRIYQAEVSVPLSDKVLKNLDPNKIDAKSLQSTRAALGAITMHHAISSEQGAVIASKIQTLSARIYAQTFKEDLQTRFPTHYHTVSDKLKSLEALILTEPKKAAKLQTAIEQELTKLEAKDLFAYINSLPDPSEVVINKSMLNDLIKSNPSEAQRVIRETLKDCIIAEFRHAHSITRNNDRANWRGQGEESFALLAGTFKTGGIEYLKKKLAELPIARKTPSPLASPPNESFGASSSSGPDDK